MDPRTVLITGCSSGFGYHMTRLFLEAGWTVIPTLRDARRRADALGLPKNKRLHILNLDVAKPEERAAACAFIAKHGRLDCLVNNAGYGLVGALEDVSEEQIRQQIDVNFTAVALLTRSLLPALRRTQGRVINVSSLFGYTGFPLNALYCASKFALEGFTEALHHELAPHGIQVALIEPGRHRTRFADNMVWGEKSAAEDSEYRLQSANLQRLRARLRAKSAVAPQQVACKVLALAKRSRMPLRTRVGRDAQTLHYLRRLLPAAVVQALFDHTYRRVFLRTLEED